MSGNGEIAILGFVTFIGMAIAVGLPIGYIAGGSYVKYEVCKCMYTKADNYIKCQGANLDDVLKDMRKVDNE